MLLTLPRLPKAAALSLLAGSWCFVMQSAVAVEESAVDPMVEIRAEIAAMREAYETKINALESRVKELESERDQDRAMIAQVQQEADAAQATAEAAVVKANQASVVAPSGDAFSEAQMAQIEEALEERDFTRGFTYNGYFRAGFGVDDEGNTMSAFRAPNAGSKFRLGNETETYVETAFGYTFPELDLPEGTEFFVGFRPSYVVPDNKDSTDSTFSVREAYASAKGVWEAQPEVSFWAGQRFYQRWDVHMSDFYYLDMSGYGGGLEEYQLGDFGKLSLAWIGGSIDELQGGTEIVDDTVINAKNTLDVRISDMDVPGGKGMLWLAVADVDDTTRPNGKNVQIEGNSGAAFGFMHEVPDFMGGYNRAMVQYGFGAAANFQATEPDFEIFAAEDGDPLTLIDYDDIWHFRFINDLVFEPAERWSLQATFVYDLLDVGTVDDSEREWISLGVRPVYELSEFVSLAVEAGVDHTDADWGESGELYKLTFAPQITPGEGYFSRPAIRFFVTYAWWSDDFEGQIAPDSYGSDTDGISVGVQAEAWW